MKSKFMRGLGRNKEQLTVSQNRGVQVIAITSGKGGVGKTNTAVNLAIALAKKNKKVLLLDADLGLANVDVMLGVYSKFNLSHVLSGQKSLQDIVIEGPHGVKVVPASSGIQQMSQLSDRELNVLIQAFSAFEEEIDYLIIDTAAGIADGVIAFVKAAQEVIVVACDEPSSITDAYALIKVLHQYHDVHRFHFLASMVVNEKQGRALYEKIDRVAEHYLGTSLLYLGSVPYDEQLKKANNHQMPVIEAASLSQSGRAYARVATVVERWKKPTGIRGHIEFFMERLLGQA